MVLQISRWASTAYGMLPISLFFCVTHRLQTWSCCGKSTFAKKACLGRIWHEPRTYKKGELEEQHQYHPTPRPPAHDSRRPAAVSIDCEMGTDSDGGSELIRVTLVDYFSSAVLLDTLVRPSVPMLHYNTKYSGVSWKDMEAARRSGNCIQGRDNARKAVWKYVGPDTIIVGHATNSDLAALRMIHPNVVDTYLVEAVILAPPKPPKDSSELEDKDQDKREIALDNSDKAADETIHNAPVEAAEGSKARQPKEQRKKTPKGEGPHSLKFLTRTKLGRDDVEGDEGRG